MKNTKEMAFKAAGIKILPPEIKGKFEGLAIIEMEKTGGVVTWGLGHYNKRNKIVTIAKDFDRRMCLKVLRAYPYQLEGGVTREALTLKKAALIGMGYEVKKVKSWTNMICDNELKGIRDTKEMIQHLTKELIEDDTLANLNIKLSEVSVQLAKDKEALQKENEEKEKVAAFKEKKRQERIDKERILREGSKE